ncbi:MAG: DNA polymerase III subunit beta [Acetanaerobacterium sp.]
MIINCSKTQLSDAMSSVSRAVAAKTTIEALEGILLQAHGNRIKLTAYDLELGISTEIDADIKEEGDIVLSARLLLDMVRRMPSERVSIVCGENNATVITGGVTQFNINGMSAEEYPELPEIGGTQEIKLGAVTLKSMISQTIFSVAVTDTRPVQTGSLFEYDGETITIVSVDGFRLALRREILTGGTALRFIVPAKTLSEVAKLIGEEDVSVTLYVGKKHVVFDVDGYHVISRLLEGDFLDYKNAIPEGYSTRVRIPVRSLGGCVERASLLITDRLKSPIRCSFEENLVKISCQTAIGRAYDEVECENKGAKVEIGFNNKFLLDALKACDTDEVYLEMNGPLSPMKILPPDGDGFLFLVLPVRIRSAE